MENIVYHYCSVDSFFHIMKESKLWLSYYVSFGKVKYDNIDDFSKEILDECIENLNYEHIVNVALQ